MDRKINKNVDGYSYSYSSSYVYWGAPVVKYQWSRTYLAYRSLFIDIILTYNEQRALGEMLGSMAGASKVQDEHGKSYVKK